MIFLCIYIQNLLLRNPCRNIFFYLKSETKTRKSITESAVLEIENYKCSFPQHKAGSGCFLPLTRQQELGICQSVDFSFFDVRGCMCMFITDTSQRQQIISVKVKRYVGNIVKSASPGKIKYLRLKVLKISLQICFSQPFQRCQ